MNRKKNKTERRDWERRSKGAKWYAAKRTPRSLADRSKYEGGGKLKKDERPGTRKDKLLPLP